MAEKLDNDEQHNQGPIRSFADDLPGPSPLAALAQIAEQVEISAATRTTSVEERMGRFPELRDVDVPTGNAARFPELAADTGDQGVQQPAQDSQYGQ